MSAIVWSELHCLSVETHAGDHKIIGLQCGCIWVDVLCCRKILEYMKSRNLMINETIFNALVKGHVKKGFVSYLHMCFDFCILCFIEYIQGAPKNWTVFRSL